MPMRTGWGKGLGPVASYYTKIAQCLWLKWFKRYIRDSGSSSSNSNNNNSNRPTLYYPKFTGVSSQAVISMIVTAINITFSLPMKYRVVPTMDSTKDTDTSRHRSKMFFNAPSRHYEHHWWRTRYKTDTSAPSTIQPEVSPTVAPISSPNYGAFLLPSNLK